LEADGILGLGPKKKDINFIDEMVSKGYLEVKMLLSYTLLFKKSI